MKTQASALYFYVYFHKSSSYLSKYFYLRITIANVWPRNGFPLRDNMKDYMNYPMFVIIL